jgi:streptogramin lyase
MFEGGPKMSGGKQRRNVVFCALVAALCFSTALAAADTVIRGVVSDDAGKPIRGAIVRAGAADKSISGFTRKDGRYEISVPAGSYDVSVEAYGFGMKRQKRDATQDGDTNFSLSPKFDVGRLSSAELESLLPDNAETRFIKSQCLSCHSFATVMMRRGSTAEEWKGFLPAMTRGRMFNPRFTPEQLNFLGQALEKYFGPDAPYFGPDADAPKMSQVKHAEMSDAALRATIREYTIPSPGAMSHSIMVDANDNAWFSEYDNQSNAVGRFDPLTETFQEYKVPLPNSGPHTGAVGKDGRIWMSLSANRDQQLASVDPETGAVKTYSLGPGVGVSHTLAVDAAGNILVSGGASGVFDLKTEKFQAFKLPAPEKYPEDTLGAWSQIAASQTGSAEMRALGGGSYDVTEVGGTVWFTQESAGRLVGVDTATGQMKTYRVPGMVSVKGVVADEQGNIWFANFQGHKLGKLNTRTGDIEQYQPPTADASPYGVVRDAKTGYIWYGDMNGDYITRFDPKSEQFVEYPVPTHQAYPRFMGVDSKGRVWFTEFLQPKIGVLDPEGSKQIAATH